MYYLSGAHLLTVEGPCEVGGGAGGGAVAGHIQYRASLVFRPHARQYRGRGRPLCNTARFHQIRGSGRCIAAVVSSLHHLSPDQLVALSKTICSGLSEQRFSARMGMVNSYLCICPGASFSRDYSYSLCCSALSVFTHPALAAQPRPAQS